MRARNALLACGLVLSSAVIGLQGQAQTGTRNVPAPTGDVSLPRPDMDREQAERLVGRYCLSCHNERTKAGSLVLTGADLSTVGEAGPTWEKVVRKLRGRLMPPAGRPRPDDQTYEALTVWIESQLDAYAAAHPNPGRTETFRRLSRTQYQNAIRDLLALALDVSDLVPADDAAAGFDNIGGVFRLSPALMESYLTAAKRIAEEAMGKLPGVVDQGQRYSVDPNVQQHDWIEGAGPGTRGGLVVQHMFPQDGEYSFTIDLERGASTQAHTLELAIDGVQVKTFIIEPPIGTQSMLRSGQAQSDLNVRVDLAAGPHYVAVAFYRSAPAERDSLVQPFPSPRPVDQELVANLRPAGEGGPSVPQPRVTGLTIGGPFEPAGPGDTPSRRRILTCQPETVGEEAPCARSILTTLARRAYRRPVTDADVEPLMAFYSVQRSKGGDFDSGIEWALRRLLVSPEFLFHIEVAPATAANEVGLEPYAISDVELASRISFLLWSSIPDDQLLEVAEQGRLKDGAVLEREVRRMLADPRSMSLTTNFAGQWLQLRTLQAVRPGIPYVNSFDSSLKAALLRETELFFDSIVREDRPLTALLDADYAFLNERLADHYGIRNVQGSHFRRVALPADSPRRGLLGQGSLLTLTSHAISTSPVFRGKYVLDVLLGVPPPEPPPDVPSLPESKGPVPQSMRERMTQHRDNPVCATCHSMIDPIGFGLENFDPVGRWREFDEGFRPIDASGVLPDGRRFSGPVELRALLTEHPEQLATTFAERLLTFALGRELAYYDLPAVRKIVREAELSDFRSQSIVVGIVNSYPFRMRAAAMPLAVSH